MMKEQLEAIRKGALEAIAGTKAAAELDALRVKYRRPQADGQSLC